MTNKKPQTSLSRLLGSLDKLMIIGFTIGVLLVLALFAYVLYNEFFLNT